MTLCIIVVNRLMTDNTEILRSVESYYSDRIRRFGASAAGVDWNGEASQHLRFEQLCKVVDGSTKLSVGDLGCGYGAMFGFMRNAGFDVAYTGVDVSSDMVRAAIGLWPDDAKVRFEVGSKIPPPMDYCVASGIFNVRGDTPDSTWVEYFYDTIMHLCEVSEKGFAFNCLTVFSDQERMQSRLYYADPCEVFRFCKLYCARNVALLHDYGLYEFTILVRK